MCVMLAAAIATLSVANAAPTTLTYTLRASDAEGSPLNGETPIAVSLWTDANSTDVGDRLWEATLSPVLSGGYATLLLSEDGSGSAIQDTWFADDVWVHVVVDGAPLGARQPISTVPRAATVSSTQGQVWSTPAGDFVLNEFPTTLQATPESTNGVFSYNGAAGRVATTARCQALMGPGARLCRTIDIERFVAVGAINQFGESNPAKYTFPYSGHWISSGAATDLYYSSSSTHMYADCRHFRTSTSSERGTVYFGPASGYPAGSTFTSTCNNSHPLLCCR